MAHNTSVPQGLSSSGFLTLEQPCLTNRKCLAHTSGAGVCFPRLQAQIFTPLFTLQLHEYLLTLPSQRPEPVSYFTEQITPPWEPPSTFCPLAKSFILTLSSPFLPVWLPHRKSSLLPICRIHLFSALFPQGACLKNWLCPLLHLWKHLPPCFPLFSL